MRQVILIPQTKALLTKEYLDPNQKPQANVVDIKGNTLSRDSMHLSRDVYMDVSGDHYMRIKPEEVADSEDEVFQGVGEVHGFFVAAPDMTLEGRFGERYGAAKAEPVAA